MAEVNAYSHAYPEFFLKSFMHKRMSEEEGREIWVDREMVRFRIAGDRLFSPAFSAHEECVGTDGLKTTYAQRHPEAYRAFKEGRVHIDGTDIAALPGITPAKVSEFKALNIHTIEALAQLEGSNLKALGMAGRDFKEMAQAHLETMSSSADINELRAENKALQARLAALENASKPVAQVPEAEEEEPEEESPFDGFTTADLKAFLDDYDVKYAPSAKRATLLKKAEAQAKENREANSKAA